MPKLSKEEQDQRFYDGMTKFGFSYDKERMAYRMSNRADEMYTVFTKHPDSEEGWYSEEIDVLVDGFGPGARGEAMEIARRVIKWGFDPKLYPAEVVHRPKGVMFF